MATLINQLEGEAMAEASCVEAAAVLTHEERLLCLRVRLIPHCPPTAVPVNAVARVDILLPGETREPLRVERDQDLGTRTLSHSPNEGVRGVDAPAVEVHEHRPRPCLQLIENRN